MNKALLPLGFVAVFAAGVVVGAFVFPQAPATATPPPSTTTAAPPPPPRKPIPLRFSRFEEPVPLPPLTVLREGRPLQLHGSRAKPLLLHLWATWCGPCIEELPSILALDAKGEVEVLAVSVDDSWPKVEGFFKGEVPRQVAWDPRVTLEPALGVRSLPTTFLIDKEGKARIRWNGMQDWGSKYMAELLAPEIAR
jgi:thiol-disulfide isomerase/thioredoxin